MNQSLSLVEIFGQSSFLLGQGLMLLVFCAVIAIPLVPLSIFLYRVKRKEATLPNIWPWLIFSLVIPILIALIGSVYYDTQNEIASLVSLGLFIAYPVVSIIVLVRAKGYRIFIACTAAFFLAFSMLTALMASMSIDNTWL